jgi:peptidoglycan/xylan/chitin deacetylase (PgdA/CDA1 family)
MARWIGGTLILCLIGIGLLAPSLQASHGSEWYKDQVAVLMYHHVDDAAQSSSTVTTKLFRDQLEYLKAKNYHFISLDEFKQFLAGASVPDNAVLVTFDDGYESFYTKAYPILKSMLIPAVNFVITGDLEHPEQTYIPSMSRSQITDMIRHSNFIAVGCHTDGMHNKLPSGEAPLVGRVSENGKTETEEEYKQRVLNDTRTCISKLNQLSPEPVDSFAYPFGITNRTAADLISQAGIRYAFTITPEMATRDADPLQIPRINAGSPNITPEALHRTILRRIVAVSEPDKQADLQTALEQIGGKFTRQGSELTLAYQGKQWTAKIGGKQVESAGGTIQLAKPIILKRGRPIIDLDDLQKVLGTAIVYHPQTNQYSVRVTPRIQ